MATIRPFRGIRPPKDSAAQVTALPYDVLSSAEAKQELAGNALTLFRITRPEVNYTPLIDEHDPRVYETAKQQYAEFKSRGLLVQDEKPCYYIYAQTRNGKTQHGLVVAAAAEDYRNGVILRHELTRRDKEDDRMRHVEACNANMGPAFFAYPHQEELRLLIADIIDHVPACDFTSADGIRHQLWVIDNNDTIDQITLIFRNIPKLYIADGHHRSAAAVRVAEKRKAANPHHQGDEEYNYFLAVCFPDDELTILDYNRIIMDLAGMTADQLISSLSEDFSVIERGNTPYKPEYLHQFSLYLDGKWYSLDTKAERLQDEDPILRLDVSISSRLILDKIFHITDLRGDKRIDFVGGIRGLEELQKRVDNGEAACALALYPTTMQQIFDVADTGNIMPPKATWFEPKLRSGMVIHELD
ncbi:MAG: DUF1015 family protein [Paludibacteraceae bacterium]|nr:DUF1015 family protein [Paludibacteraceae bacterium]